jgi:hypothetical protein
MIDGDQCAEPFRYCIDDDHASPEEYAVIPSRPPPSPMRSCHRRERR